MNSSKEFLEALAEELRYLPAKQVNEILKHYRDKINVETDYGTPIGKVLATMKSPEEIAKSIYETHGVNYLARRKKMTKRKAVLVAGVSLIIGILSLLLFFGISYFFGNIMVNQFALIINAFGFDNILDIILTTLCVLSYILIMVVIFIFVADLFIILLNGLLGKILDAKESTRGKVYENMEFTFTGWFNDITKKPKFLFKLLIAFVISFVVTGISSFATDGYINRTLRNVPSKTDIVEINESFKNIYITSNEVDFKIVEDANIIMPTITYEYEFNKYSYAITNDTLNINVEKNKTYDFLGLIQAPTSNLTILVPVGFEIDSIKVLLNYGSANIQSLTNADVIDVTLGNGNILVGQNQNVESVKLALSVGNIVSNKNKFNELNINHASGELNSGEDQINKFTHINGSSKVTTVSSVITSYSLTNSSGTIYLENLTGDNITINTETSVNNLYDINYREGYFKVNNTGKLNIVRSYFSEKITTLSNNNSYQTFDYVKSPIMDISGLYGTIVCTNINVNYPGAQINNFEDEYKQRVYAYNAINLSNTDIKLKTYEADISIDNLKCETFYLEQTRHLSDISNVNIKTGKIDFYSAVSNIANFYGEVIDIMLDSNSLTDKSDVDFHNEKVSELVVNVTKDGISTFVKNDSYTVNFK